MTRFTCTTLHSKTKCCQITFPSREPSRGVSTVAPRTSTESRRKTRNSRFRQRTTGRDRKIFSMDKVRNRLRKRVFKKLETPFPKNPPRDFVSANSKTPSLDTPRRGTGDYTQWRRKPRKVK